MSTFDEKLLSPEPLRMEKTKSITLMWDQVDGMIQILDDDIEDDNKREVYKSLIDQILAFTPKDLEQYLWGVSSLRQGL